MGTYIIPAGQWLRSAGQSSPVQSSPVQSSPVHDGCLEGRCSDSIINQFGGKLIDHFNGQNETGQPGIGYGKALHFRRWQRARLELTRTRDEDVASGSRENHLENSETN